MKSVTLLALSALWSFVAALPPPSTHALHEKRHAPSRRWIKQGRVEKTAILPIKIGLTQSNLHVGEELLMDVADPASPNYGKHWTPEQVNRHFAPSEDTVAALIEWLVSEGIEQERLSVSDNKGWLAFSASADEAEKLFHTQYYEHEHADNGKFSVGCDEYYLPHHIQEHVDYIRPGVVHSTLKKRNINKRSTKKTVIHSDMWDASDLLAGTPTLAQQPSAALARCSETYIVLPCLEYLYSFTTPSPNAVVNPNNQLGIFEQTGLDSYAQQDLDLFFANQTPGRIPVGTHPTLDAIDGGVAPVPVLDPTNGGESDLDLTIGYSIVYPQKLVLYQTDDLYETYNSEGFLDTFFDAIDGSFCTYSAYGQTGDNKTIDPIYPDPYGYNKPEMCGTYKPTSVISISYGAGEADYPNNYEQRQCNEVLKLGLQGTTIVVSSGDSGTAGQPNDPFAGTGPLGCRGPNDDIFAPADPVTCPYILSVGATQLFPNTSITAGEEAVFHRSRRSGSIYTGGSGFSNIYPAPLYQKLAVEGYFATNTVTHPSYNGPENFGANGGVFNRLGRGYPDVSANGAFWYMYNMGQPTLIGGTSMSAPIFASLLNRINEERLKIGKSTIGFVNPALYAAPFIFNDITQGHNAGCGGEQGINSIGFNASVGWDPVTGLGTPNYARMLPYFLALP